MTTQQATNVGTTVAGVSNQTLNFQQLEQLWLNAGGSAASAPTAAAIALAESGGNTASLNNNASTGDYSVGLWQINYFGGLAASRTADFGNPSQLAGNPLAQAQAAVALSNDGSNFSPWSTFTNGKYLSFLPSAGGASAVGAGIISQVEQWVGTPYAWGQGAQGIGADCSGLVQGVFAQLGVSLPRTSQEQATTGTAVSSLSDAQPGDLIFFDSGEGPNSHVGIYAGGGMMYDAPHTGTTVGLHSIEGYGPITAIRREPVTQTATLTSTGGDVITGLLGPIVGPLVGGTSAGSSIGGALSGLDTAGKGIAAAIGFIFSPRFFMALLGVGLVVAGGAVFLASTKPGQEAASIAPAVLAAA